MKALLEHVRRFVERRSLAARLTILILTVATLTITMLFYDLSRQNQREIETLQVNNLQNDVQELAQVLDAVVQSEQSRIANLALSRAVQEFVGVHASRRSALFTPTLADFTHFLDSNPAYRAVLLLDTRGEVLISTEGSYVGQNFAQSDFFQQARRGQVYMSDPGIAALDRQAVIWLSAPISIDENARPAGVVAATLSPTVLWRPVERLQIGQYGYATLLDQYGIRLAHGRDRRYVFRSLVPLPPDVWDRLRASKRFGPLAGIEDTGSHALWEYLQRDPLPPLLVTALDDQIGRVYYSAARMHERDWMVLAMLPEAEVLAPANRATSHGVVAAVLLTLLLGITVVWLAQRVMQPVPQLVQAATKIAQGDLSTPVTVHGSGEIGALADNFEVMRRNLQDSRAQLATWAQTLESRVAQRSQELAALSEVIAFASLSQSRQELMCTALDQSLTVMRADMGGIWLTEADGCLHLVASQGFDAALSATLTTFAPSEGLFGQVQTTGRPVSLSSLSQAPRVARAFAGQAHLLQACAAVPLRIYGRNLGVLAVFRHAQQEFSPESVALAASIARQIALTLHNMTLVEQVQEQARYVARLQERERIGAEIHDSTAQTISYVYLQTDQLADEVTALPPEQILVRLVRLREVLAGLARQTRQLIAELRDTAPPPPTVLDQVLRKEVERLAGELCLQVEWQLPQTARLSLSAEIGTELTRIVGEALRNAQKHGRADTAWIAFAQQNGHAVLSIRDNGCGFDPTRPPDPGRRHFGLSVMAARAAHIGGNLRIDSQIGAGTCVQVCWPVEGAQNSKSATNQGEKQWPFA